MLKRITPELDSEESPVETKTSPDSKEEEPEENVKDPETPSEDSPERMDTEPDSSEEEEVSKLMSPL